VQIGITLIRRTPPIRLMNDLMIKLSNPKNGALTFLLLVALISTILAPILFVYPVIAQTDPSTEYYEKCFAWNYDGKHWTWNLSIPKALYESYTDVSIYSRTHNGPAGYGYLTTTQDYYVRSLADKLNQTATDMGYGSYDKVSFVLAFVQSLPYTSDNVTEGYNEYPRFPIETLVDDGGDCEDTSILFATITLIMGYGTVYINPPNHYAVGILGDGILGTSWEYPSGSNKSYYYCETTGDGFKIGQLPDEFAGQSAYIYPIDQSTQYLPPIVVTPSTQPTESPVTGHSTPIPTYGSDGASPTVTDPDVQQVRAFSSVIGDNPALLAVIIAAIVISFVFTIWSARRPSHSARESASKTVSSEAAESAETVEEKFCIFCGESNKNRAVFCEKCGKQIA
jgi:hypothetical protein